MLATLTNKLQWSYRKNGPDILALLQRNYPGFMLSTKPEPLRAEIPVFHFHTVEPVSFEEKLQFLAANRYRTLDGEEFRACIAGEKPIPERSIVLTFDDGRASLWTVAFPLLRKYGFKAISFIIPGLTPENAPASKTYDDYIAHRASSQDLLAREQSSFPLCSWHEIRVMHDSGVIDFQSHTMHHHQACIENKVVDFFHPRFQTYFFGNINVPVYRNHGVLDFGRKIALGTPIYRAEPRMAGRLQFFDDEALREASANFVAQHGNEKFFVQRDWRKELFAFYRHARKQHSMTRFETPVEQKEAIVSDLKQSKQMIEERLPGKIVTQLCYPWFMGSKLAVKLSQQTGYFVNYWGIVAQRQSNHRGQDLFYVPRLEDQYIFRLPGAGRKSLREILMQKFHAHAPAFTRNLGQN